MGDAQAEGQKVLFLCISVGLVLMAGLMSGLTLGLMSLDQVDLEVTAGQNRWPSTLQLIFSNMHVDFDMGLLSLVQPGCRCCCAVGHQRRNSMQRESHR